MPTQEEFAKFLKCLNTAPLKNQLMCMLAFAGSMRREEFSALRWGDFNFTKNTVKIERTAIYISGEGIPHIGPPKTTSSERIAGLPQLVAALALAYKDEVKTLARAKRNKITLLDDPVAPDKWVFTQPDGSVGHPHAANNFLKRFCKENNLFLFTPHLLRHLHGSYLLRSGLDIAKVSRSLDHAKKSFTLDTYIHTIESVEEETASVMHGILTELKKQKSKRGQAK